MEAVYHNILRAVLKTHIFRTADIVLIHATAKFALQTPRSSVIYINQKAFIIGAVPKNLRFLELPLIIIPYIYR